MRRYISHCIREELNSECETVVVFIPLDLESHQKKLVPLSSPKLTLVEVLKI